MKMPDIPYQSPVLRYDPLAQVAIFERRNTETGEVSYQTPSPEEVKRLQEAPPQSAAAQQSAAAERPAAGATRVSLIV